MPLSPGQRSPFDICLTDHRSKQEWYIKLDGGGRAVERTPMSDDTGGIYLRSVGKRIGDFDEQRDWKGGRGNVYLTDDPTAYFDSLGVWSLMQNHLTPALQWAWATGHRVSSVSWPGSVTWKALIPGSNYHRYLARSFVPASTFAADKCWMWVKRVGNPGDLTLEICADSGGSPGTVLKSKVLTTATITDIISECYPFDWTGTESLTSATTYWVKIYGAATDSSSHHWEVGVDAAGSNGKSSSDGSSWGASTFSPYYRVTDADTDRQWFLYGDENAFYAVDKKASGNSQHYTIDGTNPTLTENTTSGLTTVSGRPVLVGGYHFFPQGDGGSGAAIRRWNGTQWRNEAASNKAKLLEKGSSSSDGPVVWKALSVTGITGTVGVKSAPAVQSDGASLTWAADGANMLDFGGTFRIGTPTSGITGLYNWGGNGLFAFKSASVWVVQNGKVREWDFGGRSNPSTKNGVAAISTSQFLYFNWLHTTRRIFGSTIDDIGQGWDSASLPTGREGYFSSYCTYSGWLFGAINAGTTGVSSVWVWDGRGWHEVFRAPYAGLQIKDVAIQPRTDKAARLWIDCGGDLVYITLPKDKIRPIDDSAALYMHEGVVVSSTIDMGAASKLPKFIRDLTLTSENLNGQGIRVEVDYQIDDKIGSNDWIQAGAFLSSPEDTARIYVGELTQFRYRLRMITDDALTPPIVKGVVPSGYARSPFRWVWSIRIVVGDTTAPGGAKVNRDDLEAWLTEASRTPGRIFMTSKWPVLNGYFVIVGTPTTNPISIPAIGLGEKDIYSMTLVEV